MTILGRPIHLTSVRIHNRYDGKGGRLRSVEVRAGKHALRTNHVGRINENTLCGKFLGPGETAGIYTVTCDSPIDASVVTLQIVESGRQILQLDEIDFLTGIFYNVVVEI